MIVIFTNIVEESNFDFSLSLKNEEKLLLMKLKV